MACNRTNKTTARHLHALAIAWLACWGGLPFASAGQDGERPNLVLIVADDLGYADVGFNGCRDIPTPNIDRVATQGMRMSAAYVSFPVCGPSRAGLLTGRNQDRFGFTTNPNVVEDPAEGLPLTEQVLAEGLSSVGYRTKCVGKWHLGMHASLRPRQRGFDEFFGFLSGGHRYLPEEITLNGLSQVTRKWDWYRTRLLDNGTRVGISDYLTDELSDRAAEFVARQSDQPFFLYLAYNAPHAPLQATQEYLDRFPKLSGKRKIYAAMVSAMDDGIGRVLDAVDQRGDANNTLIIFLSDNGGPTPVKPAYNAADNRPLRDGKGSLYEGGGRVPMAIRWPAKLAAGVEFERPVSSLDVYATMQAVTGFVHDHDKRPLDGVNLLPHLLGSGESLANRAIHWRSVKRDEIAMRSGDFKTIHQNTGGITELFNLQSDLGESIDLGERNHQKAADRLGKLRQWTSGLLPPAFLGTNNWKPASNATKSKQLFEVNRPAPLPNQSLIAIVGATLVDGTGAQPMKDSAVLVRGDTIVQVGAAASLDIPDEATTRDARGMTLLPGLLDPHLHIGQKPKTKRDRAPTFLSHGITAARDPGRAIQDYASLIASGDPLPRLFLTGKHFDQAPHAHPQNALNLQTTDQVIWQLDQIVAAGGSAVKVYYRLPIPLIKATCDRADHHGIPVTAHLELVRADHAVLAGVDGLEHVTSCGTAIADAAAAAAFEAAVDADNAARRPWRFRLWAGVDLDHPRVRRFVQ
ncbi:MAG: sulfatase-like hydrolase/transferase, partial [Planctomycetota bacterium]